MRPAASLGARRASPAEFLACLLLSRVLRVCRLLTLAHFRLSNHYQWVIFLVIMVVAIIGIWVGACIWRRRYVRKKDRVYALGTNLARATESGRVVPNTSAASIHVPAAGMFDPAPISSAGVYGEKPEKSKKKWIVRDRT